MKKILLTIVTAAALAGCLKTEDEPARTCNYDPCALKAPDAEIQNVKAYLAQNNITAQEHCSGLHYIIDSVGMGNAPTVCSNVSIRYKGMLTNGSGFDSSLVPTQYWPLSNLIRGWVNGLPMIKQGGGMRLFIPPTLGYGAQVQYDRNGQVLIPANSVLVFEVKLVGVL